MTQTQTDGRQISLATETEQGVTIKATDAEVLNGVENTKYITSKQLSDTLPVFPGVSTTYYSQSVDIGSAQTFQWVVPRNGTYIVNFTLSEFSTGGGGSPKFNFKINGGRNLAFYYYDASSLTYHIKVGLSYLPNSYGLSDRLRQFETITFSEGEVVEFIFTGNANGSISITGTDL